MSFQEREHVETIVNQLVKRLKSKDATVRQQHAKELYTFIATISRQLSSETFTKVLQQLTPQLYALLQSSQEYDQLGGLAAIDLLIDISNEDQIIRFANYLRNFLTQQHTSHRALLAASTALGHLASSNVTSGVSGTLVAAFVDFEVKRAFEWLQGERQDALFSHRRLAACFVLRELALSAPTLFHVNLTTFFQSIWGAIRDTKVEIREAATEALSACLQLIAKRQTRHRVQWYCKVYDQAFEGLRVRGTTRNAASEMSTTGSNTTAAAGSTSTTSVPLVATQTSWESAHGSLLVIGELLHNTGGFMVPRFREVCDTVLLYKDAKEKLVSRAVCVLLPELASFCPDAFVRHYLDVCLNHLMKRIVNYSATSERGIAFLSLGKMALAIGDHVIPQLPAIVKLVKEGLATHTKKNKKAKNKLYCIETLTCVANLSKALGMKFEKYLFDDLLDIMMQGGLSDELIDALSEIVASVPSARPIVQERLLDEISIILRGIPFLQGAVASTSINSGGIHGESGLISNEPDHVYYEKAISTPAKPSAVRALLSSMRLGSVLTGSGSAAPTEDSISSSPGSVRSMDGLGSASIASTSPPSSALLIKGETTDEIEIILLSLRTLSCFNFSGNFCLLPFVRDCVSLYLKNQDPRIRKEAVVTCSKLLLPSGNHNVNGVIGDDSREALVQFQTRDRWSRVTKRGPSGRVIDQVLTQILQVGICDMDMMVRKSVVDSLDHRFDELMSQENHLTMVFTFLNDESAEIREKSMQLLERLAPRNPAFVMPSLRRVLIQLITELEHTSDIRTREESTRLFGYLIRGAQHLVDPYVVRILQVLLPKLVQGNASLAIAVLVTIGELALVSQNQIAAYEHYLFPLIINTLQDHSSIEKRQAALETLGQLTGSTGCVIRPYLASPKLLEVLLSLLQHNPTTPWPLRREAMKTIGILGALDPYKYKLCLSRKSLQDANKVASTNQSSGNSLGTREDKEGERKPGNADTVDGSYHHPKLDLDLNALGVNVDFASFNMKNIGEVLDEKQQIELQLFTAAPIGIRRSDGGTNKIQAGSVDSATSTTSHNQLMGSVLSVHKTTKKKKTNSGAISLYGDGAFDFESVLVDTEMELDPTELSPSSDAYFPTVAIHALLRILKEPSLSMHHYGVIQAIMFIFKSLSIQCVPFLKYILPPFLRVLARCEPRLRESLFLQLTNLISIVNAHMKPFFPPIMVLALRFWGSHLPQIIRLMEKISQAAPQEFRTEYFPKLLPKLLEVLQPHPELFDYAGIHHVDSGEHLSGSNVSGMTTASGSKISSSPLVGESHRGVVGTGIHHHVGNTHASADHGHGQSIMGRGVGSISSGDGGLVLVGYDGVSRGADMETLQKMGFQGSGSIIAAIQVQVVQSLVVFRDAVDQYVYLLIPALVRLMESLETPLDVKIMTIFAISRMCVVTQFEHYAGARILQPLARVAKQVLSKGSFFSRSSSNSASTVSAVGGGLSNGSTATGSIAATKDEATRFSEVILYALCAMVYQLQFEILSFEPLVNQIIASLPHHHEASTQDMIQLVSQSLDMLRCGQCVSLNVLDSPVFINSSVQKIFYAVQAASGGSTATPPAPSTNMRLHVNQQNLRRAWEASQRSTKEDWLEWMRRFSIELLRESPSAALRSCCALAQAYNPLARALFNPAFVSCWNELYEQYQDYLVRALETAFQSDTIPAEILQTLLNLAEFMEHDVEALPIDIRELGELAQKCHAYAKALHYKELEFHTSPSTCIEALISINNQLGQPEAAAGILKYAQQHYKSVIEVKETWYEKLQDWQAALALYDQKLAADAASPDGEAALDIDICIGKMRCLEALGQWDELAVIAEKVWKHLHSAAGDDQQQQRRNRTLNNKRLVRRLSSNLINSGGQSNIRRVSSFSGSSAPMSGSSSNIHLHGESREESVLEKVAMLGARASWCLSQWDKMEKYVTDCAPTSSISATTLDTGEGTIQLSLYRSVLAVHHGKFEEASLLIDETRKSLDTKLGALVGESYSRAYRSMVILQQLSELEEVVTYKKLRMQVAKTEEAARYKRHMVRMWHTRLGGVKRVVDVWQQILAIRSLILSPHEDIDTWLHFASLCRQSGNLSLSLKVFANALSVHTNGAINATGDAIPEILVVPPSSASSSSVPFGFGDKERNRVAFAYYKHLWAVGDKSKALTELQQLVSRISNRQRPSIPAQHGSSTGGFATSGSTMGSPPLGSSGISQSEKELLVKCYLKLSEWQLAIHEQQLERVSIPNVLQSLKACTELEPKSYKAWHAWALMNFHVVEHYTQLSSSTAAINAGPVALDKYIAPAIQGFFRSIALGRSRWAANVQQDILRVLTLWFAHGHRSDVHAALVQGFASVSIETWLIVIPQLIARIHTPYPRIHTQLHRLLCAIGTQHPHALIYPLSVALKSLLQVRQQAAEAIMTTMRRNYVELVDEALLVSRELIRVAILWHEMWHEGLEEASRLYFGEHDVDGMVAVLQPLHAMMDNGPETLREVSFQQAFGRDLREAHEWLQRFLNNRRNESDLNRAWDLYYHVFRRINKQLPQLTTLELQYVSPNLLQARNLQLAVPGTYRAGHAVVKIGSFLPTVQVITSKQRPRRITIVGSNGLEYMFLLKGHEDLRQDERVTQLFGLVNALLINDRTTSKKDLKIHRYPVIPLSHNAGIIGWVPHCDTLHQLIRDYREARKILLNIEHRLMLQMAPDYDALTLLQKVEVFEYALENTAGQDLYKVLWLKSENSEVWLDRRTNYTRSLAVMSMVGYILGLGDRHPSNLMLHRFTGTIVHIDFGDCFEVAMHREKYPEKIPFRLTRMLTNAMEVSGIEGNFRSSCESVMQVLRENRHSLMAMLEAFVHDPLICWRLLAPTNASPNRSASSASAAAMSTSTIAGSQMSGVNSSALSRSTTKALPHGVVGRSGRRSDSISNLDAVPALAHVDSTEKPHQTSSAAAPPAPSAPPASVLPPPPPSIAAPKLTAGATQSTVAPPQPPANAAQVMDGDLTPAGLDEVDEEGDAERDADSSGAETEQEGDEEDDEEGKEEGDNGDDNEDAEIHERDEEKQAAKPLAAGDIVSNEAEPSENINVVRVPSTAMPTPSMRRNQHLPPRPSTSVAFSRPMSVSKSIPFTRQVVPRSRTSAAGPAPLSEDEKDKVVQRIDYETTNLHQEISNLAASVMSVGQGSLNRSFSITMAEAAAAAFNQPTMTVDENLEAPATRPQNETDTEASAATGGGVVRAKTRRDSISNQQQQKPHTRAGAAPVVIQTTQPASAKPDLHANRSHRERELVQALGPEGAAAPREALNEKAVAVIRRVQAKLTGRDFEGEKDPLNVSAQVQRLIDQAASHENLCQCYIGWCPFW